jgi:hypothetical protein
MPKFSVNFSVTKYMNFNFRSKMSGDHNDKATCSNSAAQEKENVAQEEAALDFFQETSGTGGNDVATSATDGNETTTGTEGAKLKKQRRDRR